MSLFGNATFSAAGYAAFRPTYPPSLFRKVLEYHNAQSSKGSLLDLGCGHGLIARELSPHFGKVTALDPSAGMIKQAKEMTKDAKIAFRQGSSEDLSFLPDSSIDMVVSGQAAHWFDYSKAWPELARVVKPGGTLAFWGYKDNILVGHPAATKIFHQFCYADGEVSPGLEGMNKYWEQPGRSIVRNLLRSVSPPQAEWQDVARLTYEAADDVAVLPEAETAWMTQRLSLGSFEGYLRTFSAFEGWREAHPERKARAEGGEGDLVDLLMERIVEADEKFRGLGERWRDGEMETVWGTYVLFARRRR